ncbi:MAG: hypothetical protein JSS53_00170 [Proteobacteria bacterium]|nr:hypothetical protein [Pseudomonadota bacterium]
MVKVFKKLIEKFIPHKRPNLPFKEGYWIRVTPVELHLDHKTAYFIGTQHLKFTQPEVDELVKSLNDYLKPEDMQLHVVDLYDWYLQSKKPLHVNLGSPHKLSGQDIRALFALGSIEWQKLFTELQMFLYHHPINQKRVSEGKPQITALWLWK